MKLSEAALLPPDTWQDLGQVVARCRGKVVKRCNFNHFPDNYGRPDCMA